MENLEEGKSHHRERTYNSQAQPRKRLIRSLMEGRQILAFCGPSEIICTTAISESSVSASIQSYLIGNYDERFKFCVRFD